MRIIRYQIALSAVRAASGLLVSFRTMAKAEPMTVIVAEVVAKCSRAMKYITRWIISWSA